MGKKKEKKITCKSFVCNGDLSGYTSSMLFDSGEEIARGLFKCGSEELRISLRICGDVSVTYKGEVYYKPSDFPDELIERIKAHPYDWDIYSPSGEGNDEPEGDVYVTLNNWFEYVFDEDGDVYEEDLSGATPGMIRSDMEYIAARYFGLGRKEDAYA